MPTYAAKCKDCSHEWEYVAKISANDPGPCPQCDNENTERMPVVNKTGFILKGKGWYKSGGFK